MAEKSRADKTKRILRSSPHRTGLARKLSLFIVAAVMVTLILSTLAGYMWGFNLLMNTLVDYNREILKLVSMNISEKLNSEINKLESIISSPSLVKEVEESNSLYEGMDETEVEQGLLEVDKLWTSRDGEEKLPDAYSNKKTSEELKVIVETSSELAEVFITDKFGGLVAMSDTTSDFYQADEEWWQKAYNNGRGAIFLGDVEFDKSSMTRGITMALPIISKEGSIIGIMKAVINTNMFFEDVISIKIGKTGHVSLVDKSSNVIFHSGLNVSEKEFINESYMAKIREGKARWLVAPVQHENEDNFFMVFDKIGHPVLAGEDMGWIVIMGQQAKEAFTPLKNLAYQAGIIIIAAVIFAVFLSAGFSRVLVNPVRDLHNAVEDITNGNWDHKVSIKTNDEVERLADAFNLMVSTLKNNQDELTREKIFTESIVSSSPDSIIVMTPEGSIKFVNNATLKLLGYEKGELTGASMGKILNENPGEKVFHKYMDDIIKKGAVYNEGLTYVTKNGGKIPVSFSGSVIFEPPSGQKAGGAIAGIVGMARDMRATMSIINDLESSKERFENKARELTLTQRAMLNIMEDVQEAKVRLEKSNTELKKLDRMKTDFVSMVSHELRTPLSITREGISLLLDKVPGELNNKQEKLLFAAKNHIDRLSRLIEELLDVSRIDAGKIELIKEITDIVNIARNAMASFEQAVKDKGIEFRFEANKDAININADPDRVTQIFTNLIDNSIKFTNKGSITIHISDEEDKVRCVVEDTGIGISEENIPKVFGRFQQFSRVAGPGPKGTGLGLSIAKGLVELHSGEIWVESKLDIGTKFAFTLPK